MNFSAILQGITIFSWLGFFTVVIMRYLRKSANESIKGLTSLIWGLLAMALLFTLAGQSLVFLSADQYGVVVSPFYKNGYWPEPIGPGLHATVPYFETVTIYSISRQTYTMSSVGNEGSMKGDDSIQAITRDGQVVFIDASVIYSIDPKNVLPVHIYWQSRYVMGLIRPVSRAAVRGAVAKYRAEDLMVAARVELEQAIRESIQTGFDKNYITLDDFLLRTIRFSDAYAAAIEQKQVAQQQAQQAAFIVEQRKQEAEQARQVAQGQADAAVINSKGAAEARLIQADAEAKANQMLGSSLSPALLQYQYIIKLAPGVQTIFIPSGNQFILPLPQVPAVTPATPLTPYYVPPTYTIPTVAPTMTPTPAPTVTPTPSP